MLNSVMFQSVTPRPGKLAFKVEPFPEPNLQVLPEPTKILDLPAGAPVAEVETTPEVTQGEILSVQEEAVTSSPFLAATEVDLSSDLVVADAEIGPPPAHVEALKEDSKTSEPIAPPVEAITDEFMAESPFESPAQEATQESQHDFSDSFFTQDSLAVEAIVEEVSENEEVTEATSVAAAEVTPEPETVAEAPKAEPVNPFDNLAQPQETQSPPAQTPVFSSAVESEVEGPFTTTATQETNAGANSSVASWAPPSPSGKGVKKKGVRLGGMFRK